MGKSLHGYSYFNPRSPHGERHNSITDKETLLEFQPTLPARGATYCPPLPQRMILLNFNPRSPHGERLISAGTE